MSNTVSRVNTFSQKDWTEINELKDSLLVNIYKQNNDLISLNIDTPAKEWVYNSMKRAGLIDEWSSERMTIRNDGGFTTRKGFKIVFEDENPVKTAKIKAVKWNADTSAYEKSESDLFSEYARLKAYKKVYPNKLDI